MGHSIIFMRFVDQDVVKFDLTALVSLLSMHGCEVGPPSEGSSAVSFPIVDGAETIGSEGYINLMEGGVESFSIERPYYDNAMKALWFDILNSLDVCSFPSHGGVIHASRNIADHIPDDFLAQCDEGLIVVGSSAEL